MSTQTIRLSDGTNTLLPEAAESGTGYVKFADGTLMQWGTYIKTDATGTGSNSVTISFPITFYSLYYSACQLRGYLDSASFNKYRIITLTRNVSGMTVRVINDTGEESTVTMNLDWFAIGRWK